MSPSRLAILTATAALSAFAQITLNPIATRALGQDSITVSGITPNLVEGREFFNPQGVVIDPTANPAPLYVADTGNNRVLGFSSAQSFANGQKADIVIGQQSMSGTFPQGPGRTSLTTGLDSPTGLAVDAAGNLYVVDSGNNRVLRFPRPFAQPGQPLPDLVIGQTSFSSGGSANQGATSPSASSLSFTVTTTSGSTTTVSSGIALDSSGNLWVADPGNNRVLRFNVSTLASGAPSGPNADMVFGQSGFTTGAYTQPTTSDPLLSTSAIALPRAIVFDTAGRLFVEESTGGTRRGRILVWQTQVFSGQPASRLLAVDEATPQPPTVSNLQLSTSPGGIFQAGVGIGVADTGNNRILIYPSFDTWTAGTTDQPPIAVIGQTSYSSGTSNQGLAQPNASTLSFPGAAVIFGSEIYIADTGNQRVMVMPESQPGPAFGAATRVLGQDGFSFNAVNLVEGREFDFTGSGSADGGLAVDLNSNPPHLYVADTYNNRILGYNDLRSVQSGQKADIVIGQPDFQHTLVNYPSNNASTPNSTGLFIPTGLVVDPAGNLYVADTGNGRVLRFPAPFANYTAGTAEQADLVLGQLNFTTTIVDTTQRTLAEPYGIALTTNPGLLVSDLAQNRVLFFKGASTDFVSGMPATLVFGQPDFNSNATGSGSAQLSSPHHISTDSEDRLYVADTGNARVQIWGTVPGSVSGTPAALSITNSLSKPRGMYVSPATGDIWVTDVGTNNATRYAPYNQLQTNGLAPNATITELGPIAAAEDQWGNLFLADAANRVAIFYPGLAPVNAANFLYSNYLTPGEISALFSEGNTNQFGAQAASAPANQFPLPTQLNGIEVLLNGSPVPIFYAGTGQINFFVPNNAGLGGIVDVQVVEVATGRTLGDTNAQMVTTAPGLFAFPGSGTGVADLAAVNKDGTINSSSNPAIQGDPIQLFGTGIGYIPGAPQDGYPATAATSSPASLTVVVYPDVLTSDQILYSGLAPQEVGVWQLNITIPKDIVTLPTQATYVVVLVNGSVPTGGPALGRVAQIYVKARQ